LTRVPGSLGGRSGALQGLHASRRFGQRAPKKKKKKWGFSPGAQRGRQSPIAETRQWHLSCSSSLRRLDLHVCAHSEFTFAVYRSRSLRDRPESPASLTIAGGRGARHGDDLDRQRNSPRGRPACSRRLMQMKVWPRAADDLFTRLSAAPPPLNQLKVPVVSSHHRTLIVELVHVLRFIYRMRGGLWSRRQWRPELATAPFRKSPCVPPPGASIKQNWQFEAVPDGDLMLVVWLAAESRQAPGPTACLSFILGHGWYF